LKKKSERSKSRSDVKSSNSAGQRHFGSEDHIRWWRLLPVLMVIALVYFYRIDRPLLWGDEADTGIEARNILHYGYPVAYDGRNVRVYDNGVQVTRNLVCKNIPWCQYYLGALSIEIFGNHTAGLRLLFAITGLCAFFPIYAILKSRIKYPDIIAGLVLISPQIVLFQRNARYYSLLILLYAVLVWHLSTNFKSAKTRFIVALLVLILLFHTHPYAAACCSVALLAFCLIFRREALLVYFFSSCIAFLSWLVWYELLGPLLGTTPFRIWLITSNFSFWFKAFFMGFFANIVDLDVVGCFPILLWMALFAFLLLQGRKAVLDILREPLFSFIFLNILIQAVATAALFCYETTAMYSILRYMPHLLVFAMISCFVVLNYAVPMRSLYLLVCMFAVVFNFLTLSFWAAPYSRKVPYSWFIPVYSEIFQPPENAWDVIVAKLRSESDNSPDRDSVIVALPDWTDDIAIFYLGDRYLVRPILDESAEECEQSIRKVMGEESYRRLRAQPEWIVDTLGFIKTVPQGFITYATVPSYRTRPDDGTRPELTRHTFSQPAVVSHVELYHLQKQ